MSCNDNCICCSHSDAWLQHAIMSRCAGLLIEVAIDMCHDLEEGRTGSRVGKYKVEKKSRRDEMRIRGCCRPGQISGSQALSTACAMYH